MIEVITPPRVNPTLDAWRWMLRQAKATRRRSMRQFAESEIVVSDGPFRGMRFSCGRQPYSRLFFDAVDSGRFNRFVATGPTQTGKTLTCYIVPILYHLFEVGETVICGVPDMDMAADKWFKDIAPPIESTRYRALMPRVGGGSRGGKVRSITFLNGATLRFMSGGGGDKSRAGFTSRILAVTEIDGMGDPGETSTEADKITQLEARTMAYGDNKRVYMECTVTVEEGRTHSEYTAATASRIALPCPHCRHPVTPEREHLVGWQDAENEIEAYDQSSFCCPDCGCPWSQQDLVEANRRGVLVHKGQEVATDEDGQPIVTGPLPPTKTLGFRWSAVNNMLARPGVVGAKEWKAARAIDDDNAEREMCQFYWAIPHKPAKWEDSPVRAHSITQRVAKTPKGMVPQHAVAVTVGVDVGKYLCHWTGIAWLADGSSVVYEYGKFEVPTDDLGVERAVVAALRGFREYIKPGWNQVSADRPRVADQVWIDCRYQQQSVFSFVRESGDRYRPTMGYGTAIFGQRSYRGPSKKTSSVPLVGDHYHVMKLKNDRLYRIDFDADYWKTFLHRRLSSPPPSPGSMLLHNAMPREHLSIAKHITAERLEEQFVPGRGVVRAMKTIRHQNHLLDALALACAAGHFMGVRIIEGSQSPAPANKTQQPASDHAPRFTTPDGRAYLITERKD